MREAVSVRAPELFARKEPVTRTKHDALLRERAGIDPAIIAAELGVTERFIWIRQRKLGLRKCTYAPRKADRLREIGA
jgi:hypothetical protein